VPIPGVPRRVPFPETFHGVGPECSVGIGEHGAAVGISDECGGDGGVDVKLKKTMNRQQAHQLLDQLGPAQFDAIVKLLEVMVRDEDDEELTAEDRRAVAASRDYFRQNPEGGIPFEQVVAECGLTMDQVRHRPGE
jgi:hypothetical protein